MSTTAACPVRGSTPTALLRPAADTQDLLDGRDTLRGFVEPVRAHRSVDAMAFGRDGADRKCILTPLLAAVCRGLRSGIKPESNRACSGSAGNSMTALGCSCSAAFLTSTKSTGDTGSWLLEHRTMSGKRAFVERHSDEWEMTTRFASG